jgi:hypothetical protein
MRRHSVPQSSKELSFAHHETEALTDSVNKAVATSGRSDRHLFCHRPISRFLSAEWSTMNKSALPTSVRKRGNDALRHIETSLMIIALVLSSLHI